MFISSIFMFPEKHIPLIHVWGKKLQKEMYHATENTLFLCSLIFSIQIYSKKKKLKNRIFLSKSLAKFYYVILSNFIKLHLTSVIVMEIHFTLSVL